MSDTQAIAQGLQTPGDVDIQQLYLVTPRGKIINLDSYLVEFNIYEDIFNKTMTGDILLSDSRNLIKELPILGDEFIVIRIKTPGFDERDIINKTFRITSITDRKTFPSIYILNFTSIEDIMDIVSPIYKSFSGEVSAIVQQIFFDYIQNSKGYVIENLNNETILKNSDKTKIVILTETSNKIKFVSPGWTPFKCLSWLCSRAIPKEGKACNFLFYETNKFFVFGSMETIFRLGRISNYSIGTYHYNPPGVYKTVETNKKMFVIEDLAIISSSNSLDSYSRGHYGSTVFSIDLINKNYEAIIYDHITEYKKYEHLSGLNSFPFYSQPVRNLDSSKIVYINQPGLHSNIEGNANEKYPYIHGNRTSNLFELTNFRMKITIPGRTDIVVGSLMDIIFPEVSPRDDRDITKHEDKLFSGKYLISAIRHKINPVRHYMILEVVKDGLQNDNRPTNPTVFTDAL